MIEGLSEYIIRFQVKRGIIFEEGCGPTCLRNQESRRADRFEATLLVSDEEQELEESFQDIDCSSIETRSLKHMTAWQQNSLYRSSSCCRGCDKEILAALFSK